MKKKAQTIFVEDTEQKDTTSSDLVVGSANHNILQLPSKGRLGYPETVEYRDIMVADEEILASASADTYARTLNAVVKAVLNSCKFYEQMTVADRDFAVVWLWANNYTAKKNVEITCQHCDKKDTHIVDLTKLPTSDLKDNFKQDFEIPIKKTGTTVRVNLHTVAKEMEAEELTTRRPEIRFSHALLISSIDIGFPMPLETKIDWVANNMTGKELGFVKQYHNYFSYGVSATIEHKCSSCGGVTKGSIPFQTTDILYPSVSDDFERLL